jgi:hypothetical protein
MKESGLCRPIRLGHQPRSIFRTAGAVAASMLRAWHFPSHALQHTLFGQVLSSLCVGSARSNACGTEAVEGTIGARSPHVELQFR